MSKWIGGGIVLAVLLAFAVAGIGLFLSFQQQGVQHEVGIDKQYKSNMNNYGQLSLKVKEALGVAKLNNADLERIIRSSLEGRYGNDGQGAKQAMLWVQENYPAKYDPSLMANVQQTIIAGRTDFEAKQNLLLDKVAAYKELTEVFWSKFWLGLAGYPSKGFDWDKYNPVVSETTQETFDKKVDKGFEIK
jgi:hypothetical protein